MDSSGPIYLNFFSARQCLSFLCLAMDVAAVSGNGNSVEISEFCKDLLLSEELLLGYSS